MQCEVCGTPVSLSDAYREDGDFVCPDCHGNGKAREDAPRQEQSRRTEASVTSPAKQRSATEGSPAPRKFKTLLMLGKFTSGCGGVLVAIGLFGILASLGSGEVSGMMEGVARVAGLFGGLFSSALGLLLIVMGQQASCFVAIERNTRSAYELLDAQAR